MQAMPYIYIAMKRIFRRDRGAARGHIGPYPLRQPKAVKRPRGRCNPGPFGALDDTSHDQYRPGAPSGPSSQHPQRSRRGHWLRRPQRPWRPRCPWGSQRHRHPHEFLAPSVAPAPSEALAPSVAPVLSADPAPSTTPAPSVATAPPVEPVTSVAPASWMAPSTILSGHCAAFPHPRRP